MATEVYMEALSPTMEEGQLVRWLKAEGDAVASGDLLAEIETDKATMELVARGDGVLRKILLGEGKTAPIGQVIAVIAAADEDISAKLPGGAAKVASEGTSDTAPAPAAAPPAAAPPADSPTAESAETSGAVSAAKTSESAPTAPSEADSSEEDGRVKASPLARKVAAEGGVPLSGIQGSGPGGRIVKRDVEQAAQASPAVQVSAPAASGAVKPAATASRLVSAQESAEDYRDIPLTQMRKTIAKRLVESIGPVPHFFLTIDVDMTRAVAARERVNALLKDEGVKISFNDIVLRSAAAALRRHPACNAHWGGDHVRQFNRVHLGVAVAVEDGLITPIIRDAHLKGLAEIALEVRELAGRAREKKLKPEEYTGATFSVSNLGMFGIEEFTAVINPPEAGILAVGALEERAVVESGQVKVAPRMKITMSCDHRVIDGATGAAFLKTLKAILEEPLAALA
jgi:pyruvate dehydrogenase E2 component (dihydrolipoamide acetyltransferase)